jgi:hypothetical protein
MNPHAPADECARLVQQALIYGCGMPFRIFKKDNGYTVEACDYI